MRRFTFAVVVVAFGVLLAAGPGSAGIGVRVSGGMSYISYADFNDFAEYINTEVLAANGVAGEVGTLHWVPEFAGEIVFPLVPMLDLGIGAGMMSGKSDFSFTVGSDGFDYKHTVKAFPMTATVYVKLPLLPFAKPYAFGGGGLYYTKLTFDETVTIGGSPESFNAELTKWGFGLQGGAGLSFSLAPKVSLDFGVKGRWAKIKGFEGTAATSDGEVDVFLASYIDDEGGLVFGPESTADKGTYSEGSVDLSGYAFTVTVMVAL